METRPVPSRPFRPVQSPLALSGYGFKGILCLVVVISAARSDASEGERVAEVDTAGDRGWYLELVGDPPGDETSAGITWTYVGQFVFDDPDYVAPLDERVESSGLERQLAAVRVDSLGREWHVLGIDGAALQRSVDDYAAALSEQIGQEYAPWDVDAELRSVREAATWEGVLAPSSWNNQDCDGDSKNDMYVWEGESRVETPVRLTSASSVQATVEVFLPGGACSGAFVDGGGKVLTAAHCVTDDDTGAPVPPEDVTVCTRGFFYPGWACYSVSAVVADPSYPGANWNISYANDFALLSVDIGGDAVVSVPLSTHSTSQLEGSTKALNGYPAFIENGAGSCLQNSPAWTGDMLFRETGAEVLAATTGLVKTRLDTTGGDSGGPILHLSGGVEFHAGVLDGHVASATQWTGGARTSANTPFILANP